MKRLFLIFLLLIIALPCFGGQTLKRHLEPETVNYFSLPSSSGDQFTLNEQIKLIKYNGGSVTLSGLTAKFSNATGYQFVTNPSVDLRKWVGYYITFTSSAGNTLKVKVSSAGTSETLDTNIFAGFDFTSGWTPVNATINDSNTFTTSATFGYVSKIGVMTIGSLYALSLTTTQTAGVTQLQNVVIPEIASNVSGVYFTSIGTNPRIRNSVSRAVVDVTTLDAKQVLTPSATGIYFTDPTTTGTFNYNAASYTAVITKD